MKFRIFGYEIRFEVEKLKTFEDFSVSAAFEEEESTQVNLRLNLTAENSASLALEEVQANLRSVKGDPNFWSTCPDCLEKDIVCFDSCDDITRKVQFYCPRCGWMIDEDRDEFFERLEAYKRGETLRSTSEVRSTIQALPHLPPEMQKDTIEELNARFERHYGFDFGEARWDESESTLDDEARFDDWPMNDEDFEGRIS